MRRHRIRTNLPPTRWRGASPWRAAPATRTRGRATPLGTSDEGCPRAVAGAVPLASASTAARRELANGANMVAPKAVETEANEVLRHRLSQTRQWLAAPASTAVHLAKTVGVRLRRETRRMNDDRPNSGLMWSSRNPGVTGVGAPRIGHETPRSPRATMATARTTTKATTSRDRLPTVRRNRGRRLRS